MPIWKPQLVRSTLKKLLLRLRTVFLDSKMEIEDGAVWETQDKMVDHIGNECQHCFDWIMTEPFCSQPENMAMTGMNKAMTQESSVEFSSW